MELSREEAWQEVLILHDEAVALQGLLSAIHARSEELMQYIRDTPIDNSDPL